MDERSLAEAVVERIFVPVEASGRHVHVTAEQAQILFGHGLTEDRPLSQPGQYLAKERVTVTGPKGVFQNVAVLGPARREAQVEISLTDGKVLGITPDYLFGNHDLQHRSYPVGKRSDRGSQGCPDRR